MSHSNVSIDGERLLADLNRLREFGTFLLGVHRPTYSDDDMESRKWLAARMEEAGLETMIDGIGNVFGTGGGPGPRVLIGSHSDTQPEAGWLDGALGVIYGLEVARALGRGVDVVSWADEEGHYASFPGSRSYIEDFSDDDIDAARNRYDGTPLRDALRKAGLHGRMRNRYLPDQYVGYLEAHIEQGDELDSSGEKIGIVTSIVGIWQYRINIEGVQNHAGTTRMAIRKDAGAAAVKLLSAIEAKFPTICGPRTVWTAGRISLTPGAASIIPGSAEVLFQFRDADPEMLQKLEAALEELVAEANGSPCQVTLTNVSRSIPKLMHGPFQDALERAAKRHAPGLFRRMPSGAGHDAQQLARVMPAAMVFVPSIGGISHHWTENTDDADIVLGCQVMASAVAEILAAAGG